MVNKYRENFLSRANLQPTHDVPVVFWGGAPFINHLFGIDTKEYYQNPELKLQCTVRFQERMPEVILVPGIWPYFGPIVEASALGCPVIHGENGSPYAVRVLEKIEDVNKLKLPDPKSAGYMPRLLEQCKYFWEHADPLYINEYGYLDGVFNGMGPLEVAAMIRGHEDIFMDFYEKPQLTHELLDLVTETILLWIKTVEKVNGKIKLLTIADHTAGQISPPHFEEFCLPYLQRIFHEYSDAVTVYHNEDNVTHVIDRIPALGAKIFHFGDLDRHLAKQHLSNKIALMGNIDPVKTLLFGSKEELKKDCTDLLDTLGDMPGFMLSSGGGMAPGTSFEKLDILVNTARAWNKQTS